MSAEIIIISREISSRLFSKCRPMIWMPFLQTVYLLMSWPFLDLFRYNIPELAKSYKVYALDLIGFGWSEKALIEYDALVWRDQVVDFVKEIVKEPAVLVGNRHVFYALIFICTILWSSLLLSILESEHPNFLPQTNNRSIKKFQLSSAIATSLPLLPLFLPFIYQELGFTEIYMRMDISLLYSN